MNFLRAGLESVALASVGATAMGLGERGSARFGRQLGSLWYRVDRRHRELALRNLELALPDLPEAERHRIARQSFRHFGSIMMDLLRFPAYGPEEVRERTRVEGWEHMESARAEGKGVVLLSAHYGHWELGALAQGYLGYPMELLARPLDNQWLERRLARARQQSGNRLVHKRNAIRSLVRALRENRCVGVLIDQNFREPGGLFVDFFAHPAATTPILGILAVRTGAAVVPGFCWPEDGDRYRMRYGAPIHAAGDKDRVAATLQLTRECTRAIEAQVRERPDYWLWMHNRWRTGPATETEPLQEVAP